MDQLNADYEQIGAAARSSPQTLSVSVGQPCCALYAADGRWYRARLVGESDARRSRLAVEFVDYGNTDTVDAADVHRLRARYVALPVQALHCRLAGVAPAAAGAEWGDDAAACFEELLGDRVVSVRVASVDESSVHSVEMADVARELVERGHARWQGGVAATLGGGRESEEAVEASGRAARKHDARPAAREFQAATAASEPRGRPTSGGSGGGFARETESWTGETSAPAEAVALPTSYNEIEIGAGALHSVVASWVVSPSEFYVQLVDRRREIEQLSRELRDAYPPGSTGVASDCTPGQPCVAFYAPDARWYRGRVVARDSGGGGRVTVSYVDYGNTAVVGRDQVRSATAQLVRSPAVQAVRCALRGRVAAAPWTAHETAAFDRAVSINERLACRFVAKQDDGVYVVELSDDSGRQLTPPQFSWTTQPAAAAAAAVSDQPGTSSTLQPLSEDGGMLSTPAEVEARAPQQYRHECGLKERDVVELEVVHVSAGSSVFHCHVVGQTADLDELMAELAAHCGRESPPPSRSVLAVGQPCAAMFSEDGAWYRATVDSVAAAGGGGTVRFVDYGNVESCSASSVRQLDARFLRIPVRRVDCRLRDMAAAATLDDVADDLLGLQFSATVVAVDASSDVVTVQLETADTGESFQDAHPQLFARPPATTTVSLPAMPAPPHDEVDVYVTHVDSPSDLYLQMAAVEAQLTELTDQLAEVYDAAAADELKLPSDHLAVGTVCCARYSADESWYRAVVEDVGDATTVKVRFVDYGNSDRVSRSDVRRLTERFAAVPACAWHCRLAGVESWADAQHRQLVELAGAGEKLLACRFVSRSQQPPPYLVTLSDDSGVDVGRLIFGTAAADDEGPIVGAVGELPAAEPPTEAAVEVCVTCAESPSDFYVQLTSSEDELSQLANDLFDEYDILSASERRLPGVDVGTLCCARYSADDAWYRAVVTDVVGATEARVLFVDYGNVDVVSTTDDVKLLDRKFCAKPAFGYHCALAEVTCPADGWTDELRTWFTELTTDEDQVFTAL